MNPLQVSTDNPYEFMAMLAFIAFALAPITPAERVATRKGRILKSYDDKLQAFLDFVLAQYVKEGGSELDQDKLPDLL